MKALLPRLLLLAAILSALASPALAQFDLEEPEAEADAAADASATDEVAATPADVAVDDVALSDFARRDPIVAAVLDLPRETPADQLSAVLALVDLGRDDVAAKLLPMLLAVELDDAQRAALVGQFGSAPFMKLIRLDAPAAEGDAPSALAGARDFAQKCLDAATAQASDPARLAKIVEQLNAPTTEDRYAARVDLRATGNAGIIAATAALAAADTPATRANLMAALGDMRPAVDVPLIAVLAEGKGQVRVDAATLAGRLKIRAALPYLAALAVSTSDPAAAQAAQRALSARGLSSPTAPEAQALLRNSLAELDSQAAPVGDEPSEAWWSWDAASGALTAGEFTPRQLRALARVRLRRALAEAGGTSDAGDRRLQLVEALEEAGLLKRELGADAQQLLTSITPAELSAALGDAMESKRNAAAARLAAELSARKDSSVLATADGQPSPLAAALQSPVRELRFAALEAIMELKPPHSFPGSSYVADALWYFAAGAGDPAVVAAAPVFARASDWAGQLRAMGYEAMPAHTGRDALIAAFDPASSTRLAVILLDGDLGQPTTREVIFQIRTADRTAQVPIIVAASPERYAAALRLAEYDPLLLAGPRPDGDAALAELVDRALALAEHPIADGAERAEQSAQALDWLAALLTDGSPYDELRRDAALVGRTLFIPELTAGSIRVLASLGTPESQAALVDFASASSVAVESRRQAADALAASIQRDGIQLTSVEILRQYDRYNASETADADTQQILGRILDVLEKKK